MYKIKEITLNTQNLLFITHLFTRLIFIFCVGFYNNYSLQSDSIWLADMSEKALDFNFNFELLRFVASPLFPIIVAIFKFTFGHYWVISLVIFQLSLSALSGVFIYKIAQKLFVDENIALMSSLIFAVFPFTLWYVHSFSQESIFQSCLIFSVYHLLTFLNSSKQINLILSAIFFSFSFLCKSHILLFSVFIPLIFLIKFKLNYTSIKFSAIYGIISLLFCLPYTIYLYKIHHSIILSSNGANYQFYLGNTEAGYKTVVDVPDKNSIEYMKLKDINNTAGYFNGSQQHYDSLLLLPQKEKQKIFLSEALDWIKSNPVKFVKLKFMDLYYFILPGLSYNHYSFNLWIISFLLTSPIYLLAYWAIIQNCKLDISTHSFVLFLFISMLIFSVIWYVQNRFRTITLEPFFIIYSSIYFTKFVKNRSIWVRIVSFYHMKI